MKKYDLGEESLENLLNYKSRPLNDSPYIIIGNPHISWESAMSCAPRHKFFRTPKEQQDNMKKRLAFLHALEKRAKTSGNFRLTDEFVKDFIERND
jgi:hypothetical protein